MTRSTLHYLGQLRCQMRHEKSGSEMVTDAPTDNHGKGEAFSPTDLVGASLLSCMVTVMGIRAEREGWNMGEVSGSVEKEMLANPRRVGRLAVEIHFKGHSLDDRQRAVLERIALDCPVALSLHPEIKQETQFHYE